MAKGNGHTRPTPKYRTYQVKGERDPAMGDIYSIAKNEGITDEQLHVMSGVSVGTFKNWWGAKATTRRPTHICLAAAAGALGYEYELVRRRKIDVDEELKAGQQWLDRQERLKKRE